MTTAVVIPAFNEQNTISEVVLQALTLTHLVIVVDDASTDSTSSIAQHAGATVLSHNSNLGYQSSLITGLTYALEKGCSSILTLDADLEHNILSAPFLIDAVIQGYDIAIAERPTLPRFAESVLSAYTRLRYSIKDITSGFKCYSSSYLRSISLSPSTDSVGLFLLIPSLQSDQRIFTFPSPVTPRTDLPRFGTGLFTNLRLLRQLLILL